MHTKAFFVLRIGVVWGGVSQLIKIEFKVLSNGVLVRVPAAERL